MQLPSFWNKRKPETHKGDYGHALLVAGSYGRMGCAILAARACMRSGVGLLTVHAPERGVNPLQVAVPEAMASIDCDGFLFANVPQGLKKYNALGVGPGIGTAERTFLALRSLLTGWGERPVVLDADALNIVAAHKDELLPLISGHSIVTPHDREYQRLFGDERPNRMASRYGITVVRKGYRTRVYAPDESEYENNTGNPGMASAGSGDVLTGVVLALLAQGLKLYEAACTAVYIHGMAGDLAVNKQSQASIMAGDIVENLKNVGMIDGF